MADPYTDVMASAVENMKGFDRLDLETQKGFDRTNLENMKGFDRVNADVLRSGWAGVDATKDARYDVATRIGGATAELSRQVGAIDDTVTAQIIGLARDTSDLRAQVSGLGYQVRDGFVAATKDSEINGLKTQVELAKQSVYLSDKIDGQAERTRELVYGQGERNRELINELKNADLNRYLIERTSELVELRGEGRYWHGNYNQSQFAAVHNQMQNLGSQLQEARQGTVNFGTMSGNAGRNTSTNNVV